MSNPNYDSRYAIRTITNPRPVATSELEARTLKALQNFLDFLKMRPGSKGLIGEVAWPNETVSSGAWKAIGERWYQAADAADLTVFFWGPGCMFASNYLYSPYTNPTPTSPASIRWSGIADVVEAHGTYGRVLRGVAVSSLEWTLGQTDPADPGTVGVNYRVEPLGTFTYLYNQGVRAVRIGFKWERIQPTLGGALDSTYLGYLQSEVSAARAAGLIVLIDCHNFGTYSIKTGGTTVTHTICMPNTYVQTACTATHLANLWTRLNAYYYNDPGVWYGIMNEPHDLNVTPGEFNLQATVADFEDGTVGGFSSFNASTTLSNVSSQYHDGSKSLQLAHSGADNFVGVGRYVGGGLIANGTQFSFWIKPPAAVSINAYVAWNSDGQSTSYVSPGLVPNIWNLVQIPIPRDRQGTKVQQIGFTEVGIPTGSASNTYLDTVGFGNGVIGGTSGYTWEAVSRSVLAQIRSNIINKKVSISLYDYSNVDRSLANHPRGPWLDETDANIFYEGHHYFDNDMSGLYGSTYSTELTNAQNQGFKPSY